MKLFEITAPKGKIVSKEEIFQMFPGSEKDLEASESDLAACGRKNYDYDLRFCVEPLSKFIYTARFFWKEVPSDPPDLMLNNLKRVMKIFI